MGKFFSILIIFSASVALQSYAIHHQSIKQNGYLRLATSTKRILHFSDVHLNISTNLYDSLQFVSTYGTDAPLSLLLSSLMYAKSVLPNPDIFLYTGDHAVHALSAPFNESYLRHVIKKNVEVLHSYFENSATYSAITGNSDSVPDYEMLITDPTSELNPTLMAISDAWKDFLTRDEMEDFNRHGYMSFAIDERLVLITLNTVPYSPLHTPKSSEVKDPFGQFEWLEKQLEIIRSENQFAYVCGHVPPIVDSYGGKPQWEVQYIRTYKRIVGAFSDVIKAQLFGHVHSVEMRLPIQKQGLSMQTTPLFTAGSISPLFGNNPSFIVWEYDAFTYELLDYSVYGSNISTSQPFFSWSLLFRASEAYKLTSLSTRNLQFLLGQFESDFNILEQYYWNTKAQSHRQPPCTNALCRASLLCSMQWWTTADEYQGCLNTTEFYLSTSTFSTADDNLNQKHDSSFFGICVTFILTVVQFGVSILVLGGIYIGIHAQLYASGTRLRNVGSANNERCPML